jgi:hypothetical protein
MSIKDTMLGYSFALQKRENTLAGLSRKTDIVSGATLPSAHSGTLSQFFSQKIEGQREQLAKNGRAIVEALVECIIQVEDRNFLLAALPTLDGILFGKTRRGLLLTLIQTGSSLFMKYTL